MDSEKLKKIQMREAFERLKILQEQYKVHKNVLNEFKQNRTIYYSERFNKTYDGVLYWASNVQRYADAVKEIEDKYHIYVYHFILNHTEFGEWLSMLYVSCKPEEWEDEKSELKSGTPYAFVYTFDELYSEFGPIEIAGVNGGLTRVN